MRWSFAKGNLSWHEYLWAALPIGVVAIGGAIGGACGGVAAACNLQVMRGARPHWQKYTLTGASSLAALAAYLLLARVFLSVTGLGAPTAAKVDQELTAKPMYAALRQADPVAYAHIRDTVLDGEIHHRPQPEITAAVQVLLSAAVRKSLPFAADAAVLDLTRATTLELDQIGAKSADACANFLLPDPNQPPVPVGMYVTTEALALDNAATEAVIESAAAHPRPLPKRAQVSAALNLVVRDLSNQYGVTRVAALAKPGSMPHDQLCALTSAMYKEILGLPTAQAALLLRFMYGQGAT